ncbi:BglII/BstYI family type II restriction endonuclease [Hoeflea sp. 108]|uniref:BglII/BstYI family type II restriction endonuclease n=1 Tax=Hoeflea sp. 108 TaxID=1116369 RepID=UPI000372D8EC|nr:BglII/BstYI family type II restriction endonuclease [Hoeflea sp. 108]
MQIAASYSHLNGLEFLEARKPKLLVEIREVVAGIDVEACRTKVSKEKRKLEKRLYSPRDMNKAFEAGFESHQWKSVQATYWVCEDARTNRKVMDLPSSEQKAAIVNAGFTPYPSRNQTDFVKERVAVEVQLGKYAFIAYDLFVKHMAFYVADKIDVGVEIVPMKRLQEEMSSGPGYYEAELYNLIREGRGVPPVPLVMFGIAPDD